MKDLQFFLEANTSIKDIKNYGKTWALNYSSTDKNFKEFLSNFLAGMNDGLKENFKYAQADEEREQIGSCMGLTNDMKKLVDKF